MNLHPIFSDSPTLLSMAIMFSGHFSLLPLEEKLQKEVKAKVFNLLLSTYALDPKSFLITRIRHFFKP